MPLENVEAARYELACRAARTNLRAYLRWIWPILNPGVALDWNWHMDQMCDLLQAWIEGHVMRVCINLPPGVSKTSVNIAASTWELLNYPERRLFCISHDLKLAWDINDKRRQVMKSERFRSLLPAFAGVRASQAHIRKGKDNIGEVATIRGGWVRAASTKTSILGGHADAHYYDDPNNAKDLTPAALEGVIRKRKDENASRFRSPRWARECVIQQHVDENDLSFSMQMEGLFDATILPNGKQLGAHLILPQEYDSKRARPVQVQRRGLPPLVLEDPRTQDGELLFPARYDRRKVEELKASAVVWSLQHQQEPLTIGHQMFQPDWFGRGWLTTNNADRPTRWVGSVDGSGGSLQDDHNYSASYLVIQIWCITGRGCIRLVDQLRMRATEAEHFGAFDIMFRRWSGVYVEWLIEEKAQGRALVDAYRDNDRYSVKPIVPETRGGTKEQRAQAWVPKAQDGWVEVPSLDARRPTFLLDETDPAAVRMLPYYAELEAAKTAILGRRTWDALEALARVDVPRGPNPVRQRDPAFLEAYRTMERCAIAQWSQPAWVESWLQEVCTFPKAPHDDQTDAASQAIREVWSSIGVTAGPESTQPTAPRRGGARPRRVKGRDLKRR